MATYTKVIGKCIGRRVECAWSRNDDYSSFIPQNGKRAGEVFPGVTKKFTNLIPPPQLAAVDRHFSEWDICDPTPCNSSLVQDVTRTLSKLSIPKVTITGERTADFIDRVLRKAWGPKPPSIDLYLRAGCGAASELYYFFQTVELFWPRFLGNVIVVLDHGDDTALQYLVPIDNPSHSYKIVYEHTPCMKGRIFNQYSYATLDRHSLADYVVTIDSDCAFHSPILPDMLFNSKAELIFPVSKVFQYEYWDDGQRYFTTVPMKPKLGQAMITQPVNLRVDTFEKFRSWIKVKTGDLYEERIAEAIRLSAVQKLDLGWYCWMCQIGVYLGEADVRGYDYHILEDRIDPYFRYNLHVNYEMDDSLSYVGSVDRVVNEGLCYWFGTHTFPSCKGVTFAYLERSILVYATYYMNPATKVDQILEELSRRRERFENAMPI